MIGGLLDRRHWDFPLLEFCLIKEDMGLCLQDLLHHPPQRDVRERVLLRVLRMASPNVYIDGSGVSFSSSI